MPGSENIPRSEWLNRDVVLLSLSAFFADMGYQAVTAVFPLLVIIELHQPAYVYGLLLALSYGVGSGFSLVGGKLGDKIGKKRIALLGNLLIPLMSLSVLFSNIFLLGMFFIFGWWARYFRTPARRAWLVEVSNQKHRSKVFGFLHALDVGGGIIAVTYSIGLVIAGYTLKTIVLVTAIPILVSSLMLIMAHVKPHESFVSQKAKEIEIVKNPLDNGQKGVGDLVFKAILVSATLFGFSYYALGFPIVTVSLSQGSDIYGILIFGVYLGVSAIAGFSLGSLRGRKPFRTLWSLGYLLAGIASLTIGLSYVFHEGIFLYVAGAAALGFATGSVETFEPSMTAALAKTKTISSRMGWLSSSRALGLFVSNSVMGFLFVLSEFDSYLYASMTAISAAMILIWIEMKYRGNPVLSGSQG